MSQLIQTLLGCWLQHGYWLELNSLWELYCSRDVWKIQCVIIVNETDLWIWNCSKRYIQIYYFHLCHSPALKPAQKKLSNFTFFIHRPYVSIATNGNFKQRTVKRSVFKTVKKWITNYFGRKWKIKGSISGMCILVAIKFKWKSCLFDIL